MPAFVKGCAHQDSWLDEGGSKYEMVERLVEYDAKENGWEEEATPSRSSWSRRSPSPERSSPGSGGGGGLFSSMRSAYNSYKSGGAI